MSRAAIVASMLCVLLLVSCTSSAQNNSLQKQLTGNQGVVMVLQNNNELSDLYLPYNGNEIPGASAATQQASSPYQNGITTQDASGTVQIGELNLLLHNVGQSTTGGGVFVSGYDPNLITVTARAGQDQINSAKSDQTCIQNAIVNDNQYEVQIFCDNQDGTSYGASATQSGSTNSQTIMFGGVPLDKYADGLLSGVTGGNVDWFSKNGFLGKGRFELTNVNGKQGVRILFGSPVGDINRALHGFTLLNLAFKEISTCADNCRVFPPRFATGQVLLGVSDQSPQGDALYLDYDIKIDRSKWPPQLNDLPQTFQITACYYYTTTLTPTVCVDPDPSNNKGDPCVPAPITYKNTQGAPIAITRIDQKSVPGGTLFTISLKHVGNGRFWEPLSLAQCGPYSSTRVDPRRENVAYLLDARMAGDLQRLDCTPKNEGNQVSLRFDETGVAQVNCLYRPLNGLQGRQSYQSAMTLEFGYLYQNAISRSVIIHRT